MTELPGWYGKIPGAGDFVSRRLAAEDVHWWAAWLQCGLQYHDERYASWRRDYVRAPVWNFVISGGSAARPLQLGCIAPSCDRVGRCYPLCLLLPAEEQAHNDPIALRLASQWLTGIGHCALDSIRRGCSPEDFDLALSELFLQSKEAQTLGGPDLTQYVDTAGPLSFWWTNAASNCRPQHHVHHGVPNNMLFGHLFGGGSGAGLA